MTILFDQEIWKWTPAREQAHPEYYIRAAAQLAHANGVFIIESVYEPTTAGEIAVEVAAAPYADVISIQSQKADQHPGRFTSYVSQSVAAIRAVSPTVPIMAGLATDAGGQPVTAAEMAREYDPDLQHGQLLLARRCGVATPERQRMRASRLRSRRRPLPRRYRSQALTLRNGARSTPSQSSQLLAKRPHRTSTPSTL
jgi:hypothetical protein